VCPPSLAVRSALRLQFWTFYWNLERERLRLSRTLPSALTEPGRTIPHSAQIISLTDFKPISLRSLVKTGRYLVINFGSCT